jgi:anti-sigma regulatory factor (Ser/Thr protein kinase)
VHSRLDHENIIFVKHLASYFHENVIGKEEFYETIRYFGKQLELTKVDLQLGVTATPELLNNYVGKHHEGEKGRVAIVQVGIV